MAVNVPEGVILIWGGTHAGIPSGWKRTTSLDNKFPKATADAVNPNVIGGNDTHTHTSPAHSHTPDAHRHYGDTTDATGVAEDGGGSNTDNADDNHRHTFDYTNVSGGILSDAVSYGAADSRPPYYSVIFIEPNGAPAEPPALVIALFDSHSLPTNWNTCDGNNSTPNLINKYLRGADTAANAGATGGSLTHQHNIDHTHSAVNHYHSALTARTTGAKLKDTSSGGGPICSNHTHTLTLSNVSEAGSAYTGNAGSADTVEPSYRKLIAIQNNTGGVSRPQYMIGLWLGTLAAIPAGWKLCDGTNDTVDMRGYHLKIDSTSGSTGGSNTHVHTPSNSHTHTAAGSHTHTGNATDSFFATGQTGAGGQPGCKTHNHSGANSVSYATSTWQSTTVQADSSNGEPAYRTVAFIQLTGVSTSGERSAEVRGQDSANAERSAQITGVNPAEERLAEIRGKEAASNERGAEISGMIEWTPESKTTAPTWIAEEKVPAN